MILTVYHRSSWVQAHPRTRQIFASPNYSFFFFFHHALDPCFLFNENVHSTPYPCYLSSYTTASVLSSLVNSAFLTSHSYFTGIVHLLFYSAHIVTRLLSVSVPVDVLVYMLSVN
jgi:hypothetical protein